MLERDDGKATILEDLAPGQPTKSDSTRGRMRLEDIKAFASTFDPQPFHLDEQALRATACSLAVWWRAWLAYRGDNHAADR